MKVKRARLPFQMLNTFDKEATAEFGVLLERGFSLIEREIENAEPNPEENAVEGSLERESLRKSLEEENDKEERKSALRDHQRRGEYGAPIEPGRQLPEQNIEEIIQKLPWKGGLLTMNIHHGDIHDGKRKEKIIATRDIQAIQPVNASHLKEVLRGTRKEEVIATRPKGSDLVTIQEGTATALAARLTYIQGLTVQLAEPVDPDRSITINQEVDLSEVEVTIRSRTHLYAYRLPSYLEPVAEKARALSFQEFSLSFEGKKSSEEREKRERADLVDRERMDLWLRTYSKFRAEGNSESESNRLTRKNSRWQRMEIRAEKALDEAVEAEEKWDTLRDEMVLAWQETERFAKEDGREIEEQDNYDSLMLWGEAHKGNQPMTVKQELSSPDFGLSYDEGAAVEVRDLQGRWHSAVVALSPQPAGEVRVRRKDGQYRIVIDPTTIRSKDPSGKLILDTDAEVVYNKPMQEIRIDKFNVILPAGSDSLRIENALTVITDEMNSFPLKVNQETWKRNKDDMEKELIRITNEIRVEIDRPKFRPNSSKDCSELFLEDRNLPVQRVNKKSGTPAMDKETLQVFSLMGDETADKIIAAREAQSKFSQLTKWGPFAEAGEVQCIWNQLGQPHGRYSCESPNLQNRIVEIRETIEAEPGYKFVSFDLGQAEYVVFASLTNDPTLIAAFGEGKDFHQQMWNEIEAAVPGVNLHEQDHRKSGKTINFAILYMMMTFTLSKKLGVSSEEAQRIIDGWRQRAPVAVTYMENYIAYAKKTGQTSTKFGRTRYMPELKTAKGNYLRELTKTAWHHHNAGTASEILKIKQIKAWRVLRRAGISVEEARLVLQMHDELIFHVKDERVSEVEDLVGESFSKDISGFVPFRVDQKTGQNWKAISK